MSIEQVKSALRAGETSGAIKLCERALGTETRLRTRAELLHLRAVAEQADGDLERAVGFALQSLEQDPTLAKGWNTLAILQHRAGRTIQAIEAARTAVSADPDMAEGHLTLASLYRARRRPRRAADAYLRALKADPESVPALFGLGATLLEAGDADGALDAYRALQRLRPGDVEVEKSIAAILVYTGRGEEAARQADLVLRLQPDNLVGIKIRLEYGPLEGADAAEAEARRISNDQASPWLSRSTLMAALARRAERQGDLDAAFRLWEEKNRVASEARSYSRTAMDDYVGAIRAAWSRELILRTERISSRKERPVLVLGMPRSGTTLVEQILGQHRQASPGGELYDLGDLTFNFMPGRSISRIGEIPEAELESRIRQMSSIYADALAQYGGADRVVIDKMPQNFTLIGLASILMPNLKVIRVRRDPRDVCFSIWKLQFGVTDPAAPSISDAAQVWFAHRT